MPTGGDFIAPFVGFGLTVLVFSYLIHDNPAYRFAVNFLAGLTLSYALVVVLADVIIPRVIAPLLAEAFVPERDLERLLLTSIVPLIFGTLVLLKLSRGWLGQFGNWGMAVLVGVGAGMAVGGALTGSLIGLGRAAGTLNVVGGWGWALLALVATVTTLISFWYSWYSNAEAETVTDARPLIVRVTAVFGRIFLMITFGALFGGALVAGVATLVDRLGLITQIVTAVTR